MVHLILLQGTYGPVAGNTMQKILVSAECVFELNAIPPWMIQLIRLWRCAQQHINSCV